MDLRRLTELLQLWKQRTGDGDADEALTLVARLEQQRSAGPTTTAKTKARKPHRQ